MKKIFVIWIFISSLLVAQNPVELTLNNKKYTFYSDSIVIDGESSKIINVEVDLIGWYPMARIYTQNELYILSHASIATYKNSAMKMIEFDRSQWVFDPWIDAKQYQDDFIPYDYHTTYAPKTNKVCLIER